MPVRLPRERRAYVPPQQLLSRHQSDANTRIETWNYWSREEMERHQAYLRQRAPSTRPKRPQPATITEHATHAAPFDRKNWPGPPRRPRSTTSSYAAPMWRPSPPSMAVRGFVLNGEGECSLRHPSALAKSDPLTPLNTADLVPAHAVCVGSDGGGRLCCELEMFGRLPISVLFPGCWPRVENVIMVHHFDAVARTTRKIV